MSSLAQISLALALLVGGCTVMPPAVDVPPDDTGPRGAVFADVVLGFTSGGSTTSCIANGVPLCGQDPTPQPACVDDAPFALGMNDGKSYTIDKLGRIELGFLCSTIVEVGLSPSGGPSNDFMIYGSVTGAATPIVEVSLDGTLYTAVNFWHKQEGAFADNPGFQLEVPMLESARFVRISETSGGGTILVDALEALPRPQ